MIVLSGARGASSFTVAFGFLVVNEKSALDERGLGSRAGQPGLTSMLYRSKRFARNESAIEAQDPTPSARHGAPAGFVPTLESLPDFFDENAALVVRRAALTSVSRRVTGAGGGKATLAPQRADFSASLHASAVATLIPKPYTTVLFPLGSCSTASMAAEPVEPPIVLTLTSTW
jgi:hypothetical protein